MIFKQIYAYGLTMSTRRLRTTNVSAPPQPQRGTLIRQPSVPLPLRVHHHVLLCAGGITHTHQVVLAARREDKLQQVADEIKSAGGEAAIVVGDTSKVDSSWSKEARDRYLD